MNPREFSEHISVDPNRQVLDGSGHLISSSTATTRVIRVHVTLGDLLFAPVERYHQFMSHKNGWMTTTLGLKNEPKRTPHDRSQDEDLNPFRIGYLSSKAPSPMLQDVASSTRGIRAPSLTRYPHN
ncbi:hypothetical protein PENSPDRAFT_687273 [Peniophora sp. CONT]|nr:hypothetical protein PENSPDRAFT_687273 [Peniophora sp. CONT]